MFKVFILVSLAVATIGCRQSQFAEEVIFLRGSSAGVFANPASGLTTTEAGGSATFALSLIIKPTSSVTLTLSSTDTAEGRIKQTAGACATGGTAQTSSCTLTFTAANYLVSQNVEVAGQDDNYVDGNKAYGISITAASTDTNYNGVTTSNVQLTNTDNDTAGFVATPASGLVTKTGGVTATGKIKLSSQPTGNVVFTVQSDNTAGGDVTTPASKSFTFTNANWNTTQNLVVAGGASAPLDYKIIMNGNVTSSDPNYSGITGTALHTGIGAKNISASDRFIFVTNTFWSANLGGASGADTKCNADANKPNGSSYKAMLGGGGRTACTTPNCGGGAGEHTDWALYPTQQYRRPDTTIIGTTNLAGVFTFPLTLPIEASGNSPWTGLATDWTTSGYNCGNWASTSGSGTAGSSVQTTSAALDAGFGGGTGLICTSNYRIYCAEQ